MGFMGTGDKFCCRGNVVLEGTQQCVKVVDDILLWDPDGEVLMRCRALGIAINAEEFVLAAPEVSVCGLKLS